jgi:HK97 family phage portal protein
MSLFARRRADESRSTVDLSHYAQLWQSQWQGAYSPMPVSIHNAVTHAASSACIDALATSVSTLPVDVVRQVAGARRPVEPPPPLIAQPSSLVESDVWMYQLVDSMLTDGNGFGFVQGLDSMQRPTAIDLIDPAKVVDRRVTDGVPIVTVINSGDHALYPWGDVWHIPGKYVKAGTPFAESPIRRAAATIGGALAAREFGSRFFGDGGHPGGLISASQDLTADQAAAVKRAFMNAVSGNREPAVLGAGLTYQPLMVDPNDSQFIELMRFSIEEACRFWRVPPSMVYAAVSGQNVTYSNVSQADLHYLKHSLEGLLVRVERAMSRLIARPQVVRFNRNAFLRSDPETRWKIHDRRLRNKTTSVNRVLMIEDELPFDGPEFDEPGIPGGPTDAPREGTSTDE